MKYAERHIAKGKMKVNLEEDDAPNTIANFIEHAKNVY